MTGVVPVLGAAVRTTPAAAVLVAVLAAAWCGPASAQDAGDNRRLNQALAVLRTRMSATGRSCLSAMQHVHEDEDQIDIQERINPGDGDRPNKQLDIARDVLGSDYEIATGACEPDARRVCAAPDAASAGACAAFARPPPSGS